MKRPVIIILSVIGIFLLIGVSTMRLMGPKVGNTFSTISNFLPNGAGGGAPMMEMPAAAEPPAMTVMDGFVAEDAARQASNTSVQTQERIVIENADLAKIGRAHV